ncbi:hypothetical protein T484DRAFT_1828454 [Baffinella frigidus]|nr:hypothetical protein T484DRAFT_1828454 [Cryptophyta sp. CCMP2293]
MQGEAKRAVWDWRGSCGQVRAIEKMQGEAKRAVWDWFVHTAQLQKRLRSVAIQCLTRLKNRALSRALEAWQATHAHILGIKARTRLAFLRESDATARSVWDGYVQHIYP